MVSQFFQAAWIVDDLDAAMRHWLALGSTGPFYVNRRFALDSFIHRGQSVPLTLSSAFAQTGPIQIELIQQHSDSPSPYRDAFPNGGGFHHLCALVEDYDAEVERFAALKAPVIAEGRLRSMRFAYVDARAQLGAMLEFAERTDAIVARFETVARAAIEWDGRNPVRSFD